MLTPLLRQMFPVAKPIIAMAHFPPLPGTPLYDPRLGIQGTIKTMCADVDMLITGGVDGILFCYEGDRPYALRADFEAVAVMTRVISEIAAIGTCGMVPGLILLDAEGNVLRPSILQNDARTIDEIMEQQRETNAAEVLDRTGSATRLQDVFPY
jgi:hypothetical protein